MNLEEFVGKKINVTELAKRVGYDRAYLCNIFNGKKKMSKFVAKALEKATNGKLNADELLRDNQDKNQVK